MTIDWITIRSIITAFGSLAAIFMIFYYIWKEWYRIKLSIIYIHFGFFDDYYGNNMFIINPFVIITNSRMIPIFITGGEIKLKTIEGTIILYNNKGYLDNSISISRERDSDLKWTLDNKYMPFLIKKDTVVTSKNPIKGFIPFSYQLIDRDYNIKKEINNIEQLILTIYDSSKQSYSVSLTKKQINDISKNDKYNIFILEQSRFYDFKKIVDNINIGE